MDSWVGEIPQRRDRLPTPVLLGFPRGSAGKESACSAGNLGSIPGLGRSPREGKGYPLQCYGLENSMDCVVHEVSASDTPERLSLSPFPGGPLVKKPPCNSAGDAGSFPGWGAKMPHAEG